MTAQSPSPVFTAQFNINDQEFSLAGVLRPHSTAEIADDLLLLRNGIETVSGVLYVNLKRVTHMNSTAFRALTRVLVDASRSRPEIKFVVVASSVVAWAARMFRHLSDLSPNIAIEIYNSAFYPGQTFVENQSFIPILRTQTKMTWRHEREILPRHGLRNGMVIADICCGIGDFAMLVRKEFGPARIVALDHSSPSLDYARDVAERFDVRDIEYTYGDASQMLFESDQFDFVTCRHSLQIFDRPELLLRGTTGSANLAAGFTSPMRKTPIASGNRGPTASNGPITRSPSSSVISTWTSKWGRRACVCCWTRASRR